MVKVSKSLVTFTKIASTGLLVQFLSFLLYPVIGRIYDPEEFGQFAFFSSLVVTLSIFITGQYHNAVVNPDDDGEALQLISLSFWISLAFSVLFFICVLTGFFFYSLSAEWLIAGFYLLAYSMYEIFKMFLIRQKRFDALNISQVINRLGSNLLKITRPMAWGSGWLLISEMICNLGGSFYILHAGKFRPLSFSKLDFKVASKYIRFPLYQSTSLLIQFAISELPSFYFKSIGDLESLGYYSMGNRLFVQPCILLGNSLHPILVHSFKKRSENSKLHKLFAILALAALMGITILKFFGTDIISLLLGSEWANGSSVYDIQIWLVLTKFYTGVLLAFIISHDKSPVLFKVRLAELVLLIFVIVFFKTSFLPAYVGFEVLADLFLIAFVLKNSSKS